MTTSYKYVKVINGKEVKIMKLTEERKGELALLFLKTRFKNDGIRLKPDMRRQIGNDAAKIGIKAEEAVAFVEELVREMVEEIFPATATSHVNLDNT
ncbi:hypothetical protein H0W91_01695 [Patescibacteria group bacterium]|nr:hypothetical protein [Patescibacteria group bacterium]